MLKRISICFTLFVLLASFNLAQSKLGLQVKGGAYLPQGDMGDLYGTGFGGNAGVTYNLSESFQLTGTVGYMTFSFDNSVFYGTPFEGTELDAKLNIIPVMVGARYLFSASSVKPYANLNLGLQFISVDVSNISETGKSKSESKTGWGLGLGVLIKAGEKMDIDLNAGYNGTALEFSQSYEVSGPGYSSSSSSSSTGTWFSFTAGLHFAL